MNNNNNEMDSNNFVITKLEVLTNIELKKEYKKLANQYLLLDENFKKLKAINKNQEDTIYILERNYNDLKKNSILSLLYPRSALFLHHLSKLFTYP